MSNEEDLTDTVSIEKLREIEAAAASSAPEAASARGQAESQRRELRRKAIEKIATTKKALKESRKALKAAKKDVVRLGPANMHLLDDAKRAVEHNEICVEHYEAVLATLERPELLEQVEAWDRMFNHDERANHSSLFLKDIAPEVAALTEACQAFAQALAGIHGKFGAWVAKANNANAIARSLADDGIRVRASAPNLVTVQQLVSGNLRKALVGAGLGIGAHWIRESLRPDHYVDPGSLTGKADAA